MSTIDSPLSEACVDASSDSYFARVILRHTYGINPKDSTDPFLRKARIATDGLNEGGTNAYLVDFIPALKYIPDWVPGTGWKKVAQGYREKMEEYRVAPFEYVRQLHVRTEFGRIAYLQTDLHSLLRLSGTERPHRRQPFPSFKSCPTKTPRNTLKSSFVLKIQWLSHTLVSPQRFQSDRIH